MNRHSPCGETDFLPTSAFAASEPLFVVWTMPSSQRDGCRLVSTPSHHGGLGSALASALPVKRSPSLTTFTQQIALLVLNRQVRCVCRFRHRGTFNSGYQAQAECGLHARHRYQDLRSCRRLAASPKGRSDSLTLFDDLVFVRVNAVPLEHRIGLVPKPPFAFLPFQTGPLENI